MQESQKYVLFHFDGETIISRSTGPPAVGQHCVFLMKDTSADGPLTPDTVDERVAFGQMNGSSVSSLGLLSTCGRAHELPYGPCQLEKTVPTFSLPPHIGLTALQLAASGKIDSLSQSAVLQLESRFNLWIDSLQAGLVQKVPDFHSNSAKEVIATWEACCTTLQGPKAQLEDGLVRLVVSALSAFGSSTSVLRFEILREEIARAVRETQGLDGALKLLNPLLQRMAAADDLLSAADATTLAMHALFLVSCRCVFLDSSVRIGVLLNGMAQDLCSVVQTCIDGEFFCKLRGY